MANYLLPHRSPRETFALLKESTLNCGRRVTDHEINDAIKNAKPSFVPRSRKERALDQIATSYTVPEKRWPDKNWELIDSISRKGERVADFEALSPDRADLDANEAIDLLWPNGNPNLCLAANGPEDAKTKPKTFWRSLPHGFNSYSLTVPSVMTASQGINKDGEYSSRCLGNTGPRGYLVIEFDFVPDEAGAPATPCGEILARMAGEEKPRYAPDLCAGIAIHMLSRGAPVSMAVFSGTKSIHLWHMVRGASNEALKPFFAEAHALGADPITWTKCQLVRMPGGIRFDKDPDKGIRQKVLYVNKKNLPAKA